MAVTYVSNLVLYTGTEFDQTFVLEDSQSNSVKDLTGYTACAQMKRYESSLKTADFQVSFANDRTCLLYTSPSPRDQRGARMPSSA